MNNYSAYGVKLTVQSPREQEATAFRLASRRLREATSRHERNRALNINHEMWSILFRELNSAACVLPEILKQDCIHLALWSLDYSNRAVLSDLPLAPLAEINETMAEGLDSNERTSAPPVIPVMPANRFAATAICA